MERGSALGVFDSSLQYHQKLPNGSFFDGTLDGKIQKKQVNHGSNAFDLPAFALYNCLNYFKLSTILTNVAIACSLVYFP